MATLLQTFADLEKESVPFTVTGDFVVKTISGTVVLQGRLVGDSGAYAPLTESAASKLNPNNLSIGLTRVTPFESGMSFTIIPTSPKATVQIWTL